MNLLRNFKTIFNRNTVNNDSDNDSGCETNARNTNTNLHKSQTQRQNNNDDEIIVEPPQRPTQIYTESLFVS